MGTSARTASARASDGRSSTSTWTPSRSRWIRAWYVSSVSSLMTTRSTRTPRRSSAAAKRSWVSGRSADRPCSRIAIALASHAPIQMGRYRSPSGSLRMTTWRFESMWTRTLSMTISTRPAITGLSHRLRRRLPSRRTRANDAQQDAADVREERHAAVRRASAERADAADQLEHEPEAQEDDRRDLEQLVEEAEEDQGQDARPREQHDVHAERRRDR